MGIPTEYRVLDANMDCQAIADTLVERGDVVERQRLLRMQRGVRRLYDALQGSAHGPAVRGVLDDLTISLAEDDEENRRHERLQLLLRRQAGWLSDTTAEYKSAVA